MLDFGSFRVLTFDCYGTLIDWENGIWNAVGPVLAQHGVPASRESVLELYGRLESRAEHGEYQSYRTILRRVMQDLAAELGFTPRTHDVDCLVDSIGDWQPFPDTVPALAALKARYKLAIVSNIDDEFIAQSARALRVEFDWIVTAQQVGSYKPSLNNFRTALARIGEPQSRVLHVAQSLFHDIQPARSLGLSTVWVNRRRGRAGSGATPPSDAKPDFEVPDLLSLVDAMG
ncbi:MAG TPA: haloacid dehalogenase type II [Gemmatimonadaceae bacterium]|nr:haloacid dehalogenase type II [Gemmatimonadaceae bacterium]